MIPAYRLEAEGAGGRHGKGPERVRCGVRPQDPRPRSIHLSRLLAGMATISIVGVPLLVIPAMTWASLAFRERFPEKAEQRTATISLAISDAAIAAVFHPVVTTAAVLLAVATVMIIVANLRTAGLWRLPPGRRRFWLTFACVSPAAPMASSCFGMWMLGAYRLGEATFLHLVGSFAFFLGQTAAIALCALSASLLASNGIAPTRRLFFSYRMRAALGYAITLAAIVYGALFALKDIGGTPAGPLVRAFYVQTEFWLIVTFLCYLLGFLVDTVGILARDRTPEVPAPS